LKSDECALRATNLSDFGLRISGFSSLAFLLEDGVFDLLGDLLEMGGLHGIGGAAF
jgi:hypothetical protein